MGWQALVIRIGGTLAGLAFLGVLFWFVSRCLRKHRTRQLKAQLVEHLRSVGVDAEEQKSKNAVTRTHEDEHAVILRHLVTIRVWLKGIQSIEIWRITRMGDRETVTLDEMTFVISPEPGMILNRIPILTNLVKTYTTEGKNGCKWHGFEWGRLPLLVNKLKVDTDLNSRLAGHLETGLADNLRITALSGNRIGITTNYSPQQLPSRGFLTCIEDISDHIRDYIAEQNRVRKLQESK